MFTIAQCMMEPSHPRTPNLAAFFKTLTLPRDLYPEAGKDKTTAGYVPSSFFFSSSLDENNEIDVCADWWRWEIDSAGVLD